jgi:NAD(P)-dependent dehydrogenase (short-subunit alcohol dehydrogenase family)
LDFKNVNYAVLKIEKELGPIEAAISNAGHYEMKSMQEVTDESLVKMFAVHLGGFRNIALSVLPLMRKRKNGSLICITSELGIGGGEFVSHYSAAKGAQIGLVKTLSLEYAPFNIRVNAVAPGPTDTPLIPLDSPERQPKFLNTLPLKRLVKPEEISQTVWFLAKEGTFFSGEIISPNAGAVI